MQMRLLLVAVAIALPCSAQPTLEVTGQPVCSDCRITLTRIASLGGTTEAAGLVTVGTQFTRDSRGRYFMAPTAVPGEIKVYSSEGRVLASLGRRGRGPGEFRSIDQMLIGPGDSLHVFDGENGRHTVFGPDLRLARSVSALGVPMGAQFLADGRSIQQLHLTGSKTIGLPLHIISPSGAVQRSFGAAEVPRGRVMFYMTQRSIWPTRDGTGVWAAHFNRYQIELWDTTGALHRVVTRKADWFPPWTPPQRTSLVGVREDAEGLLWTLVAVMDPPLDQKNPQVMPDGAARPTRRRQSVLEVIDPVSGRLLASLRTPLIFTRFVGDLVAARREHANGELTYEIYRVRLTSQRSSGSRTGS